MSRDDMAVVACRIMRYLYDCMRRGVEPDDAKWSHEALGIPYPYWSSVVDELVGKGYVRGVKLVRADDATQAAPVSPRITLDGAQYLEENSLMRRALAFLSDIRGLIEV